MALVAVSNTQAMVASQVQQLIDLLKGVMSDQPVTISNTLTTTGVLTGPSVSASGLTGSVQAMRLVGATTTGAPTSGAHVVGDAVLAQDGFWWICITAGTPGTWRLAGAALEVATPAVLSSGGTVGTSLNAAHGDHAHPWTGLGVLANTNTWAGLGTFNAGVTLGGGSLIMNALNLNMYNAAAGAYIVDDGTYLSFITRTARSFYVQSSFTTTYIYTGTVYLGDGSSGSNVVHLRNALIDANSWSLTAAGLLTATGVAIGSGALTKSYNSADNVPTIPSAAGARIWIQAADPGGSANNGDIWFGG